MTDSNTHHVPISEDGIHLSDRKTEHIYTLTEDAAPAGYEVASSVQFKVKLVDETVCLYLRTDEKADWERADKRLITMVDKATPHHEDTPEPTLHLLRLPHLPQHRCRPPHRLPPPRRS